MSKTDISDVVWDDRFADLDFVPVVSVDVGEAYEWDEFHAWWSPTRRMFFWGSGAGCSCNSWGDDFYKIEDFENGRSVDDVKSALKRYFDGQYRNHPQVKADALAELARFDGEGE